MKIEINDLYEHIGSTMVLEFTGEDKNNMDFLNGTYLLMEVEDTHDTFFDIKNNKIVTGNVEDYLVRSIYTPVDERLELFYEANVMMAMQLTNEGWTRDGKHLNISPLLEKIEIIKILREASKISKAGKGDYNV